MFDLFCSSFWECIALLRFLQAWKWCSHSVSKSWGWRWKECPRQKSHPESKWICQNSNVLFTYLSPEYVIICHSMSMFSGVVRCPAFGVPPFLQVSSTESRTIAPTSWQVWPKGCRDDVRWHVSTQPVDLEVPEIQVRSVWTFGHPNTIRSIWKILKGLTFCTNLMT